MFFYKLFDTKDKNTIKACQYYTGILSFDLLYELNRLIFIRNQMNSKFIHEGLECDNHDFKEFNELCKKFNIIFTDSKNVIKEKVWLYFRQHISQVIC